jgi:hypothetical protein
MNETELRKKATQGLVHYYGELEKSVPLEVLPATIEVLEIEPVKMNRTFYDIVYTIKRKLPAATGQDTLLRTDTLTAFMSTAWEVIE